MPCVCVCASLCGYVMLVHTYTISISITRVYTDHGMCLSMCYQKQRKLLSTPLQLPYSTLYSSRYSYYINYGRDYLVCFFVFI